jgi:inosose dehydratase
VDGIRVACASITWPRGYPRERLLAEIAEAGYAGTPVGPAGAESAAALLSDLAGYGLQPAPGYLGLEWWASERRGEQLERARREAAFHHELGLTEIYVAPNLTPERRAISGQVTAATATPSGELAKLADLLNEVGRATAAEGVRACLHNHVGSAVETRDEIDRLLGLVDPAVVFLGADLGHLAWASDDAAAFTRDHAARIKTLHLKDISPTVRAEGVAKKWDYRGFSDHGIFVELGEGLIDYPAVFVALRAASFQGWIVAETDVTQKPTALASAVASRRYLASLGV